MGRKETKSNKPDACMFDLSLHLLNKDVCIKKICEVATVLLGFTLLLVWFKPILFDKHLHVYYRVYKPGFRKKSFIEEISLELHTFSVNVPIRSLSFLQ